MRLMWPGVEWKASRQGSGEVFSEGFSEGGFALGFTVSKGSEKRSEKRFLDITPPQRV